MVESNLNHQFHNSDAQTYHHYPENLRLPPEVLQSAEKSIELGANKHKLKLDLMKETGGVVPLKLLHNIQNKRRLSTNQTTLSNLEELHLLLEELQKVPDAIVQVYTDDDDELIGI